MFHRLALSFGLILVSFIALEQSILAQNVDVPFSGIVSGQAGFDSLKPGTTETTVSSSFSGIAQQFDSITSATVGINSSVPATITISPPQFVSGPSPDPSGTTRVAYLKFGSTQVISNVGGGSGKLPAGNTNLQVDMLVKRPVAFTPGNYTYSVKLTITP
ncbi:hypothetical protein RIVM261_060560 [Rivularia sp. IAM M-261]|nr:hypothetical protein RIVM261_060560 [Rivularia sp. IAM M-261]